MTGTEASLLIVWRRRKIQVADEGTIQDHCMTRNVVSITPVSPIWPPPGVLCPAGVDAAFGT